MSNRTVGLILELFPAQAHFRQGLSPAGLPLFSAPERERQAVQAIERDISLTPEQAPELHNLLEAYARALRAELHAVEATQTVLATRGAELDIRGVLACLA